MHRVGFACKYRNAEGKQPFPNRTVTATSMRKHTEQEQYEILTRIIHNNVESLIGLIKKVGRGRRDMRMFRVTSDLMPLYSHEEFSHMYEDLNKIVSERYAEAGKLAREKDIRLSFHPGQYTVLASDKPHVVDNAIKDIEYHTDIAKLMGYGREFQDFKINIHLSGSRGQEGFRENYLRLSEAAQRMLTVENDEVSHGLDSVLGISDLCPIVLDIHHHWVKTGEHIQVDDDRVWQVIESWSNVRPTMHYSVSRPEHIGSTEMPMKSKLEATVNQLRAHSEFFHNEKLNSWAASFLPHFDIMCESKGWNESRNLFASRLTYAARNQT